MRTRNVGNCKHCIGKVLVSRLQGDECRRKLIQISIAIGKILDLIAFTKRNSTDEKIAEETDKTTDK